MNVVGKIGLGLSAALALNWGVPTYGAAPVVPPKPGRPMVPTLTVPPPVMVDPVGDGNQPYGTIVARNIFSLVPIPPPPPPPPPPVDPPPKITANGIMSVFGELQALFKVTIAVKPGQPAKDVSYMLAQGQRQDDIEVTKIDPKASSITFDNHGTVQEIPLADGQGAAGGSVAPTPGQPLPPGSYAPDVPRFHPRPGMPASGVPNFGLDNSPGNPGAPGGGNPFQPQNNNSNPGSVPVAGGGTANAPSVAEEAAQNVAGLTLEQQQALVELNRLRLQAAQEAGQTDPKTGYYPPEMLPPTGLTPPESLGGSDSVGNLTPPRRQ